MRKVTITVCLLTLFAVSLIAGPFRYGTTPLVDGKSNPDQIVISNRNPIITWEYTGSVSSFTVTVSQNATFASVLWNYTAIPNNSNTPSLTDGIIYDINPPSGSTVATSNYKMTRIAYNADSSGTALLANKTYYVKVDLFDDGTLETASSQFSTQASEVTLGSSALELAVDWNNPFNPWIGEYTKFRFCVNDHDRRVKLRIFSISGDLVKDYSAQTLIKNAWATLTWDGRNNDGEMVARGIYIVNLIDIGDQRSSSVTKRVAVVR